MLAATPVIDLSVLTGTGGTAPKTTTSVRRRMETIVASLQVFYSRRIAWATLFVTSLLLSYVGGAVMFCLHARWRGEAGPPISDWYHWFLDSTIGFVALTPALFLIIPGALWALGGTARRSARVQVLCYAALVGVLFAIVTGPGPIVHNMIAGEGTPLANAVTDLVGHDSGVALRNTLAAPNSPLTESLLQLGAGMPVYIALTWLAAQFIRTVSRRQPA